MKRLTASSVTAKERKAGVMPGTLGAAGSLKGLGRNSVLIDADSESSAIETTDLEAAKRRYSATRAGAHVGVIAIIDGLRMRISSNGLDAASLAIDCRRALHLEPRRRERRIRLGPQRKAAI